MTKKSNPNRTPAWVVRSSEIYPVRKNEIRQSKYSFTEEVIQKNYEWLLEKKDFLKCTVVEYESNIVGIHILIKEPTSSKCFIKTLWLEANFRNQGLGMQLKLVGEKWAREQGAKKLVTHVMANNLMMFEMTKEL